MKNNYNFLLIFLYTYILLLSIATAKRDSTKILHWIQNQQQIVLHNIEKPNIFEVDLLCNRNTTINFILSEQMRSSNHQIQLMLRLDYMPNRCIIAKQDLPPLGKNQSRWSVTFQKRCCDIWKKPVMERQRIVATVRDAFIFFGFPISYKFWNQIVPIVVICVILALIWSLDMKQTHKHCIKRYSHSHTTQQPLKNKQQ